MPRASLSSGRVAILLAQEVLAEELGVEGEGSHNVIVPTCYEHHESEL